jgi:hypothetical protein
MYTVWRFSNSHKTSRETIKTFKEIFIIWKFRVFSLFVLHTHIHTHRVSTYNIPFLARILKKY